MADWGDATVQVTGIRRSRFVEFDFSLGDDLVVELVMPFREFRIFCEEHHARMLPAEGEAALELMRLGESEETATKSPPSRTGANEFRAGQEETT